MQHKSVQEQEVKPTISPEKEKEFLALAAFVGDRSLMIELCKAEIAQSLQKMNEIRMGQEKAQSDGVASE